jgi:hypothetical protein
MKKHPPLIASLVIFLAPVCMAQKSAAIPAAPEAAASAIVSSEASVTAPRPQVDGSITKLIDTFFDLLARNQIDKAYERLTLGTKIAEQEKDVATLRAKTQQAIQYLGEVRGHELVAVKNVGTHLLAATYLSLGKDFPLRWRFYFYRAEDVWKLIDIRVDDRLMDMFDDKSAQPQPAATPAGQ